MIILLGNEDLHLAKLGNKRESSLKTKLKQGYLTDYHNFDIP
jgi:hypothetical protein